nr:hypothetical protein GCM10020093_088920 [Planobispora longispora]
MTMTLADARVVTPEGVHDGWLTIEDGRITHVGQGTAPGPGRSLGGRYVVPGFVDIHNHGGAGGSFPTGDPDEASRIAALHARHGTTTLVASLVTASLDNLARATSALADLCEDGLLAGIHFEGPYIAKARCGAHDPRCCASPRSGSSVSCWRRAVVMCGCSPSPPSCRGRWTPSGRRRRTA